MDAATAGVIVAIGLSVLGFLATQVQWRRAADEKRVEALERSTEREMESIRETARALRAEVIDCQKERDQYMRQYMAAMERITGVINKIANGGKT